MIVVYLVAAAVGVFVIYWLLVARHVPKYPPLDVSDDDPRMQEAVRLAQDSIGRLRELIGLDHKDAQVKVSLVTSSGVTEHLWAELISLGESETEVRYLTPPVTHAEPLERVHKHGIGDIEDWAVFSKCGDIYGGYTQRVMFAIAREQYGELPPELAEQESRYVH